MILENLNLKKKKLLFLYFLVIKENDFKIFEAKEKDFLFCRIKEKNES